MSRDETLREMVLGSTADDYESFFYIQEQIGRWVKQRQIVELTQDEIALKLETLICSGHIRAYELSPKDPHSKVVDFIRDRLDEFWYLVTAEGLKEVEPQE
jgi:hypothetical protein